METSTKTRIGRRATSGGDAATWEARVWLGRQLRWERRLSQLRSEGARR